MTEHTVREYTGGDVPALIHLWSTVFGDSEEFVAGFFRCLPGMGTGAVAVLDGEIVGAAYAITGLELDGRRIGYIYAVAVDERARHHGIGESVTRYACELARKRGAEIICTMPAEPGLFAWYERIIGTKHRLSRRVYETDSESILDVRPITAAEYRARREALLADRAHLVPCAEAMEFEKFLCGYYGGGLFAVGDGICAALRDWDTAFSHELISDVPDAAAKSVGSALGCTCSRYYETCCNGEDYIASVSPLPDRCVFTFSFE